jgi:hypothetical protein
MKYTVAVINSTQTAFSKIYVAPRQHSSPMCIERFNFLIKKKNKATEGNNTKLTYYNVT